MRLMLLYAAFGLWCIATGESRGLRLPRQAVSSLVATACKKNPNLKFCPKSTVVVRQAAVITNSIVAQVLSTEAPIPSTVPRLSAPPVSVPTVNVPQVVAPTVNVPQVVAPTVNVPQVVAPTVNVPQVVAPTVNVPQVVAPTVNVPQVVAPTVNVPQVVVQITAPPPDGNEYCDLYNDRFYHYCGNITSWGLDLQKTLIEYCPIYSAGCNRIATTPRPTFPPITYATPTTLQPCTPDCTAPHCTEECKCDWGRPRAEVNCGEDKVQAIAFFASNCEAFHRACDGFYEHHGEYTPVPAGERDSLDKHNENPHTQFFTAPDSTHTDWLNGNVRSGSDFGVPAFGISGNTGETSVSFPSLGSFLPGGRRRKRSTQIFGFEAFRPDMWVFQ